MAQRYYGLAATETGRPLEGAEAIESAIAVLRDVEPDSLGPAYWGLGNALSALSEPGSARRAFLDAAAAYQLQKRTNETGHAFHRAAEASWDLGDLDEASGLYEKATPYAAQTGDLNLFLACRRARGATLALSGEVAEGLPILDSALSETVALQRDQEIDATVDEDYIGAMVNRQTASVLADLGRFPEAVKRAEDSEAALVPLSLEVAAMVRVDRGRYLAGAGRTREAETTLRDALSDLSESQNTQARVEAASALAQFLDHNGRSEEADQVWERFGPDAG
ncbi:tetratricopeptide repeat protein [Knoellia koreensis]|uniref:Tetratricopeptide repeat protein n=1 Tax=Knoellia koreensis TaxID=2730921 RepID=A0A849H448_9MICO|nr:tetratricopeptide repeat protein [Knoellia sp. DB2414S]NNM44556.1 tetratricopeptide repeat protein [Knoellia sp. DB2414S]